MSWTSEARARLDAGDLDGFAEVLDAHYEAFSPPQAELVPELVVLLQHVVRKVEAGAFAGQEAHPLFTSWLLVERLVKNGHALPAELDAGRLSRLAELSAQVGDDADAPTHGRGLVLLAFPEDDRVLDELLKAGAATGGYFAEDALLAPAARCADPDRRALFVALHLLGAYTQTVRYRDADKALADLLAYHVGFKRQAPALSVRHFRDAESRLKALGLPWNHLREADRAALEAALPDPQ